MASTTKILGLFPGQGSQKVGMGKELVESSPRARALFEQADRVLGFKLSTICFEGPAEKLTLTAITQPAILTVSVICYELLKEQCPCFTLAAAAGHSLGEYSALVAAGAISFEDAVQLVNKRGSYMQEAVPAGVGKMAAILSKSTEELEEAISKVTNGLVEIANVNAPGQIVIAGNKEAVDATIAAMPGVMAIELPVSAPFHCGLMKPAAEKLAKDLDAMTIRPAAFPVYANYSAMPLTQPEDIRQALKDQVCGRVRWVESMDRAIKDLAPESCIEFGAGKVLAGLMKRINPKVARLNLDSAAAITTYVASIQETQAVCNG